MKAHYATTTHQLRLKIKEATKDLAVVTLSQLKCISKPFCLNEHYRGCRRDVPLVDDEELA